MSDQSTQSDTDTGTGAHRAGLFDIRIIIGALIGIYGVILTAMGIFGDHTDKTKADGVNINLWAGLVMIAVAIAFGAWARLRPIVVPDHVETEDDDRPPAH
jgi:uncharacterized membrane protein